jgi:ABC-type branched-subunit amino acid transport system ATPase component
MNAPILIGKNLTSGYVEGIDILTNLSIEVTTGEITGIIGPNGAGKSTLLKTVFNFITPRIGRIYFEGKDITGVSPFELKRMGISFMLQDFNNFPEMSVRDNLLLGAWSIRNQKKLINSRLEEVYDFFPLLKERQSQKANYLSGGIQRMLSLGKEIMTKPRLFLVDEPSAGLAPAIVTEIYEFLKEITKQGTTVLLVDQNILKALEVSDRMYLLEMGEIKKKGPKKDFKKNIREIIQESMISD